MTKKKKSVAKKSMSEKKVVSKEVETKVEEPVVIKEAEGIPKPIPQAEEVKITPVEEAPAVPVKKKKVAEKPPVNFIY